jgi:long-chain acyl-CoA synthetase
MTDTAPMTDTDHPFQPRHHARRDPDRTAFHIATTGERVSFAQLEARANQGAHRLRQLGLTPGSHVALLIENRREVLEICFAADRTGVYYTAISTHLTEPEVAHIIRDCGARLVLVSDRFAALAARLAASAGPGVRIEVVGTPVAGLNHWCPDACPEVPIDDEVEGLDMLYSSGTTGRPKGIRWPLSGQKPGGRTMLLDLLTGLFGYDADTRYLCTAPLYHAAPLRHAMVTIRMGGSVHVMGKFDAAEALRLIEAERITHSQWVPTMFVRLLKLPQAERQRFDLSSQRVAVHAAAPCPVGVKRAMIDWWGPILHEYYAGTENNGFTAITTPEWLAHPGSVGRAKLGIIHICDADGQELPAGAEGEVYFENGHPFAYHNDPAKTAESRNARGWTTLGDIGRLDAEGYLYLTDRKSFVIISGGVNIYPQETEDALVDHPAVLDAAVIGVPNEEFGEEVLAVVELVAGAQPSEPLGAELIAHCRQRLSAIKCPRRVVFRQTLPRSPTGKLMKRLLRDEFHA